MIRMWGKAYSYQLTVDSEQLTVNIIHERHCEGCLKEA